MEPPTGPRRYSSAAPPDQERRRDARRVAARRRGGAGPRRGSPPGRLAFGRRREKAARGGQGARTSPSSRARNERTGEVGPVAKKRGLDGRIDARAPARRTPRARGRLRAGEALDALDRLVVGCVPRALADAFARCNADAEAQQFSRCSTAPPPSSSSRSARAAGSRTRAIAAPCSTRAPAEVSRLSVDHRASEPSERARVEAAGGTVEFDNLEGMLAVSRGLGDFDFARSGFA